MPYNKMLNVLFDLLDSRILSNKRKPIEVHEKVFAF